MRPLETHFTNMSQGEQLSYWFQDFVKAKISSVKPKLLEKLEKGKDHSIHKCIFKESKLGSHTGVP